MQLHCGSAEVLCGATAPVHQQDDGSGGRPCRTVQPRQPGRQRRAAAGHRCTAPAHEGPAAGLLRLVILRPGVSSRLHSRNKHDCTTPAMHIIRETLISTSSQVLPVSQCWDGAERGAVRNQLWHGAGSVPAHHCGWHHCTIDVLSTPRPCEAPSVIPLMHAARCTMRAHAVDAALQNAEGLLDQALRVFGLLGAVLVAVVEIELEAIIGLVRFTEYWSGRAIVQVHVTGQQLQQLTVVMRRGPAQPPEHSDSMQLQHRHTMTPSAVVRGMRRCSLPYSHSRWRRRQARTAKTPLARCAVDHRGCTLVVLSTRATARRAMFRTCRTVTSTSLWSCTASSQRWPC